MAGRLGSCCCWPSSSGCLRRSFKTVKRGINLQSIGIIASKILLSWDVYHCSLALILDGGCIWVGPGIGGCIWVGPGIGGRSCASCCKFSDVEVEESVEVVFDVVVESDGSSSMISIGVSF